MFIIVLLIFFMATASVIGFEVRQRCAQAQVEYGGDCVEALRTLIEDEEADFENKNSAVWALGQLGDVRALSFLRQYYNGGTVQQNCDRSKTICQHELQKAIKLLDGGFNISAFVWR